MNKSTHLKLFLPVIVFAVLAGFLFKGLYLDPQLLPSPLIGQSLPDFDLPTLHTKSRMRRADLPPQPFLLNVWASWCVNCIYEHPLLMELAERGVPIIGINYKDLQTNALKWLTMHGDPYRFSLLDEQGMFGLDIGVYGVPETYVISRDGIVLFKQVGELTRTVWEDKVSPLFSVGHARQGVTQQR